ncbi:MAG: hypothetical protein U0694_26720 [Anaerolineae bacterium]
MKFARFLAGVSLLTAAFSLNSHVFAQDSAQTITLNDATPSIDVVVNPVPDASGAIALQLSGVAVSAVDSAGNTVFLMSDARAHGLELHFAPNATSHTVSVTRLEGIAEGYVTVVSQADLTPAPDTTLVNAVPVSPGQEVDTSLTGQTYGTTLPLSIPADTLGMVNVGFPAAPVSLELVDSSNQTVLSLAGGEIDGFSVLLESGSYNLTLLNRDYTVDSIVTTRLYTASPSGLPAAVVVNDTANPPADTTVASTCTFQVDEGSVSLHSGPGMGYSQLGTANRGDALVVGGSSSSSDWVLVAWQHSAAWVDGTLGTFSGDCSTLTVYSAPYRDGTGPSLTIQPGRLGGLQLGDDSEHEDDEHEGGEHEDGD